MGSAAGVLKGAARRVGLTVDEYNARRDAGERWCCACKAWHAVAAFGADPNRSDGIARSCLQSRHTGNPVGWHGRQPVNPLTGRPGPVPTPAREDDRKQARQKVNQEVIAGRLPRPNAVPCTDCDHRWEPGERRHEYDHHLGYAAEHHLHVQAVCTRCHHKREASRG